jgi:hypothetical protein
LAAQCPSLLAVGVLGIRAEVLWQRRLALEGFVQGPVAGDLEQLLDLAAGLAGAAECDRLLS